MARQLRLEFPGALYHVTARGNARQDIFDDEDRQAFLDGQSRRCPVSYFAEPTQTWLWSD